MGARSYRCIGRQVVPVLSLSCKYVHNYIMCTFPYCIVCVYVSVCCTLCSLSFVNCSALPPSRNICFVCAVTVFIAYNLSISTVCGHFSWISRHCCVLIACVWLNCLFYMSISVRILFIYNEINKWEMNLHTVKSYQLSAVSINAYAKCLQQFAYIELLSN